MSGHSLVLERLHGALSSLQLATVEALLESHLEQAARQERPYQERPYADFLVDLMESEVDARRSRALSTRLRMAGLPYTKSLSQFDFSFQPSIDEKQIRELQTLQFAAEARNVILLGPL